MSAFFAWFFLIYDEQVEDKTPMWYYLVKGDDIMNFIKVGSACPVTKVADVDFNVENINLCIDEAYDKEVKYLVFP